MVWYALGALLALVSTNWQAIGIHAQTSAQAVASCNTKFVYLPLISTGSGAATAAPPGLAASSVRPSCSGDTPLYETFELSLLVPNVAGNPFTTFANVTFTQGARSFTVDGFYDGDSTWRARFMPDALGEWRYTWAINGATGSGKFTTTARANPLNHGHVNVDPANSRYLRYDDGTPHYWVGGKWINATNYGPASKGGQINWTNDPDDLHENPLTEAQMLAYLDALASTGHNGILIKVALFPLENDRVSWDLGWIQRGEWLVREAGKRGIYVQINFFDTWARAAGRYFEFDKRDPNDPNDRAYEGADQVFNVWADGDDAVKQNYIRTIIARFGGYSNVYWELGNEMEHAPNDPVEFRRLANQKYIPWIRQYDPYDLPIGVSEMATGTRTNVDIVFAHQAITSQMPPLTATQAWQWNEMYQGWKAFPDRLVFDRTMRNPEHRLGYRRAFWRMFVTGGTGASEATLLNLANPLNDAALTVMRDHQRLREFIEQLPVDINTMQPLALNSFVTTGPDLSERRTRAVAGQVYVTYLLLNPDANTGGITASAGSVTVNLPAGSYNVVWYDPQTGSTTGGGTVVGGGARTIDQPAFAEDIVLLITRAG